MTPKTILHIEVNNKEFNIKYSGNIVEESTNKDDIKHDERLMRMLVSDKKVFDFFYRIVEPARRFYVREAKKEIKKIPLTH